MSLIFTAIIESASGSRVQVKLEQLEDPQIDGVPLRLTVHKEGVSISDELIRHILDDSAETDGMLLDLTQIQQDVVAWGGKFDILAQENGNSVVCDFCFRRAE